MLDRPVVSTPGVGENFDRPWSVGPIFPPAERPEIVTRSGALTTAEIYRRICVRDPYFALQDLVMVGPGEVTARLPVQLRPGAEVTPISVAEAGRHLAILGSCAGAVAAPADGQHYYLACAAHGQWLQDGPYARGGEVLRGRARTRFTGRRTATARTVLTAADRTPLFSLDVDYRVVPAAIFERLFADARMDMRRRPRRGLPGDAAAAMRQNPYRTPLELANTRRSGDRLIGSLVLRPDMCNGHFAMHPTMPVAVAASAMTRLAGQLLGELEGMPDVRWMALEVLLTADSLAYANQTVTFTAGRHSAAGDEHTFHCSASVDDRAVASLELTLRRIGESPVLDDGNRP